MVDVIHRLPQVTGTTGDWGSAIVVFAVMLAVFALFVYLAERATKAPTTTAKPVRPTPALT